MGKERDGLSCVRSKFCRISEQTAPLPNSLYVPSRIPSRVPSPQEFLEGTNQRLKQSCSRQSCSSRVVRGFKQTASVSEKAWKSSFNDYSRYLTLQSRVTLLVSFRWLDMKARKKEPSPWLSWKKTSSVRNMMFADTVHTNLRCETFFFSLSPFNFFRDF